MRENSKNFNFAILTYFIIVIMFVALRMCSAFGFLDVFGDYSGVIFSLAVQVILLFGGSVFLFSKFKKNNTVDTLNYYGCKKISKQIIVLTIILGIVVFMLNVFVSSTFNSVIDFLGYEHSMTPLPSNYGFDVLFVNLVFSALLPGICEELVHRGMLLKSMKPLGMWKAILLSGFLFGLLHMNIEQFFYATIIGIFLGFLTVMTNSIYPAMIVHFTNNALSIYVTFSRVNNLPVGNLYESFFTVVSSNFFLGAVLCLIVIVLLGYSLYALCKKIFRLQLRDNIQQAAEQVQKSLTKQAYFLDLQNLKNGEANSSLPDPRLEIIKQLFALQPTTQEKFVPKKSSSFIMWVTFALMGIITIFTFIWGVL